MSSEHDSVRSSRLAEDCLHVASTTRGLPPEKLHPMARLPEDWEAVLSHWGEKRFRARQVFRWIHARGVIDPELMTDLPKALRQRLTEDDLRPVADLAEVREAADGTRKLLLVLRDDRRIECVMIPMTCREDIDDSMDDEDCSASLEGHPGTEGDGERLAARIVGNDAVDKRTRVTLCVSTQHGCAMGCVFCASGRSGLGRGLGAAEIVTQVIEARRRLKPNELLTNLVFMGMGEPLHHYDETARAIRLLTQDDGVGLGLRRMTVSTVGLVAGIERLGRDFDGKVGLAVSLHAPTDELRSRIVPLNERINLATLLSALRRYPLPKRRRITIEYTLIDGLNDGRDQARELARILRPLRVKINLIAMNPVEGSGLNGATNERVARFRDWLVADGYSCFIRTRRGDEVSAACGQLALSGQLLRKTPV